MSLVRSFVSFFVGAPADWRLPQLRRFLTRWPRIRPKRSWLGWVVILGSVVASWFAFDAVQVEEGAPLITAFSLWVGATSILLMAWSFLLALRVKLFEPIFGGLDGVYKVHRWVGTLAVLAMFAHTAVEPEVDGIAGAARSVADSAEDLAGVGEVMIYGLLGATLLRILPYRWWRWTHKMFGLPFLMASWHFFTAEKPYENTSAWGVMVWRMDAGRGGGVDVALDRQGLWRRIIHVCYHRDRAHWPSHQNEDAAQKARRYLWASGGPVRISQTARPKDGRTAPLHGGVVASSPRR